MLDFDWQDEDDCTSDKEYQTFCREACELATEINKVLDKLENDLCELGDFDPNNQSFADMLDAKFWQKNQLEEAIFLLEAAACNLKELEAD